MLLANVAVALEGLTNAYVVALPIPGVLLSISECSCDMEDGPYTCIYSNLIHVCAMLSTVF